MAEEFFETKQNSSPKTEHDPVSLVTKAGEHAIRFSGLANAGGVVATITVLGATAKNGEIENILALPLGFFALGIVLAILATFGAMIKFLQKAIKKPIKPDPGFRWLPGAFAKIEDISLFGGLACFILGAVSGVAIVAVA